MSFDSGIKLYRRYYPLSRNTSMTRNESDELLRIVESYTKIIRSWTILYCTKKNKGIDYKRLDEDILFGESILKKYTGAKEILFEQLSDDELMYINMTLSWESKYVSDTLMKVARKRMVQRRFVEK